MMKWGEFRLYRRMHLGIIRGFAFLVSVFGEIVSMIYFV
jgi:hypothetical protein